MDSSNKEINTEVVTTKVSNLPIVQLHSKKYPRADTFTRVRICARILFLRAHLRADTFLTKKHPKKVPEGQAESAEATKVITDIGDDAAKVAEHSGEVGRPKGSDFVVCESEGSSPSISPGMSSVPYGGVAPPPPLSLVAAGAAEEPLEPNESVQGLFQTKPALPQLLPSVSTHPPSFPLPFTHSLFLTGQV